MTKNWPSESMGFKKNSVRKFWCQNRIRQTYF